MNDGKSMINWAFREIIDISNNLGLTSTDEKAKCALADIGEDNEQRYESA